MRRVLGLFLAAALVAAACGDDGSDEDADTSTTAAPVDDTEVDDTEVEPEFAGSIELSIDNVDRCEFIGSGCLLPFPSDALTSADPDTATGRRVNLNIDSMPVNTDGIPINPARQNRNDGFSPGSAALVLLPGLDPAGSALPPITDIARSLDPSSGSVVIDATTGEIWPHWAELDANATEDGNRPLFLRPAVNFPDGHRIVIGLRNLVDGNGTPLEPTDTFRAYRDRLETDIPEVEARRPAMEEVFADLEAAGVSRDELVLAWDFTIISTESLAGPLLHMRDDAFALLDDSAPSFTVDRIERREDDGYIFIEGTYDVPLYLTGDGSPGTGLNLSSDPDLPDQNGIRPSVYRCMINDVSTGADPGAGVIYGHGLLGDRGQVTSSGPRRLAALNNFICGTDLIGMAEEDIVNAVTILGELSAFSTLTDRLLQGHLNTLFLGRLMRHPDGFASDAAFQDETGAARFSIDVLSYYGISQGGIMGPVSTAVSFDWDRAVYGVPGINYSTLLNRSVDFDAYAAFLDPAYPDKLDQAIALLVIQMLWDRGEGNGYVNHFTDPLPGVNEKVALIHGALGDHQVANVAMDVMARSIGAAVVWPAVGAGRTTDVEPFWAIPRIESYPFVGSATVMWDSGSPVSPIENLPPRDGIDPHEDPRRHLDAVEQIDAFLRTGTVVDICGGSPCMSPPRG